jgi:hypothetical protein
MQDIQGFVAGTLDTVSRFVSNIRTRPQAQDTGPITANIPNPSGTSAQSSRPATVGAGIIAVVLIGAAVFLFMRK